MWHDLYTQSLLEKIDILSADSTMQRMAMHHIYEYEKGIRPLVLCTLSCADCEIIIPKLEARHISYHIKQTPNKGNVNLFFGKGSCVDMVTLLLKDKDLHELDDEQDFMIGAMLGYDIAGQCERYLSRHNAKSKEETVA